MGTRTISTARAKAITQRALEALEVGAWLNDPSPRNAGVLQARKLQGGEIAYYFRYTDSAGRRDRLSVGASIPLVDARRRAQALSARLQAGDRDLRSELDNERREREQLARDDELRREAAAAAAHATLGALLDAYVSLLKAKGATTFKSVQGALHRHVKAAWPRLWALPANDVTTSDLVDVVGRLVSLGKDREAAKLRSYLIASFRAGITASQNPMASPELRALKIAHNPASDILPISGANGTKERALSDVELRAYWSKISAQSDEGSALLRFHLLTGGQRLDQLNRVQRSDLDVESMSFRIQDIKGRRQTPRTHVVPLTPAAVRAMEEMGGELGPFLFSLTRGKTGASTSAIYRRVTAVSEQLQSEGMLPGGLFGPGDLRRTVETTLARHGVNKDIRAQLQSHGLGGVQDRHYDRHHYLDEKRAALETLFNVLEGSVAV